MHSTGGLTVFAIALAAMVILLAAASARRRRGPGSAMPRYVRLVLIATLAVVATLVAYLASRYGV